MKPADGWRQAVLWGALVLGAVAVCLWLGNPRMLDPTDTGWIVADDPLAHELGWEQFRASPMLQYPIGKNEGYGLERSTSIVFSDSIPIAALALRPLSPILPHPFQYLGWWTLLSVLLQGYWGVRLIRLRSDRLDVALAGAGFFLIAPTMLQRIGMHTALTSQWMILCALWLYFSSRELSALRWTLLLLLAVSVHAYLFVMIGGIWVAHLAKCAIARSLRLRSLGAIAAAPVLVGAWMHCLGYATAGRETAAAASRSQFDLANFLGDQLWSSLRPLVHGNRDGDGWDSYAYLGLGLLCVAAVSLVAIVVAAIQRQPRPAAPARVEVSWAPLVIVALGFTAFAASNRVWFDGEPLFHYAWPWFLRRLTLLFHGSGRLIWPTYYVIMLALLWSALRAWPPRVTAWVLTAGLVIQILDLRVGAGVLRDGAHRPGLVTELRDPVWSTVATRYRRLVSIPAFHGQPDRHALAWFCGVHGIGTNIGYFGRVNRQVQEPGAARHLEALLAGTYEPDTAYSFPAVETWNVAKLAATPRDLAVVADGHYLLLPGAMPPGAGPVETIATPPLDTWLPFAAGGVAAGYLVDGWAWRESWGTWSDGKIGTMIVPVPRGHHGRLRVTMRWQAHTARNERPRAAISLDQTEFSVEFRADSVAQEDSFEITPTRAWIAIRTTSAHPVVVPDGRLIGLGLEAMRLGIPDAPPGGADPAPQALLHLPRHDAADRSTACEGPRDVAAISGTVVVAADVRDGDIPAATWHRRACPCILLTVRWILLFALLLAAGPADARPPRTAPRDEQGSALWREVIEPHGAEVAQLVARARVAMGRLTEPGEGEPRRLRLVSDAYGMLRYAHKLSPDNTDVLGLLGHAADELGKTRQAVDALESCVRIQGPERAGPEVTGRLGTIYLRMGKLDDAVRWLRYAQGPIAMSSNAAVTVHLATALAARGEMSSAIDVLRSSLPAQGGVFFTDPVAMVSFALAVHYDRDEQPGAAFEILDRMQSAMQQELGACLQRTFAELRHAPAEEAYYYQALLYEALGDYAEARTEWLLYAGVPDAMWRRRALDHVRALDELRGTTGGAVHTRAVP